MYLRKDLRRNPESKVEEPYWRVTWSILGGPARSKTITLGFLTEREARARFEDLKILERLGRLDDVVAPKTSSPRSPTRLGGWLSARLELAFRAQRAEKSTIELAQNAAKPLERLLGHLELGQLRSLDVEQYILTRLSEGMRSRTVQIELNHLKRALKLAVKDELLACVPEMPRLKVNDAREHRFLSTEQCQLLLNALPWREFPASALATYVGLDLGLRKSEILSRRWEDVRFEQGLPDALILRRAKSRKLQALPLTAGLAEALLAWWVRQNNPTSGWIFPSPTGSGRPMTTFRKSLSHAAIRAGLPHLWPHALRHTWASRAAAARVDRALLKELGGWTSTEMLDEVYAHAYSDHAREALERAASRPGGVVLEFRKNA